MRTNAKGEELSLQFKGCCGMQLEYVFQSNLRKIRVDL